MEKVVQIKVRRPTKDPGYEIKLGYGNLSSIGTFTRAATGIAAKRVGLISNEKVFGTFGGSVTNSLQKSGFAVSVWLMKDGERYKNLRSLEAALRFFSEIGLSRTDTVVALGGGVVGDLAGFAASIHLRGIPVVQVPTTLLSMIDSSVGGKTGVNTAFGKNLVGSFHRPAGVLIDTKALSTLPKRQINAGLWEALKHGAIANQELFDKTEDVISRIPKSGFDELLISDAGFQRSFINFLADQIAFKAEIVVGDERESAKDIGPRSRKILNFGHTFAHALEFATDYAYLKHGEAVGYGIVFAAELSKKLGLLDENVVNLLRGVVHRTGKLPAITNIDRHRLFDAIGRDKKNIGGSLNWVLLKGIGKPVIVPHEKIGDKLVKETIARFTSQ